MKTSTADLYGGVEAGGTKFICVLADSRGFVLERIEIPTAIPAATLLAVRDFFLRASAGRGKLVALGIACFGPLDLDVRSQSYGYITKSPRLDWSQINLVGYFKEQLDTLVEIETEVNGSAVGEFTEGVAVGCENFVYVTVGTGIGAGIFAGGKLMQGISHPEVGHMLIPIEESDRHFEGSCPFHQTCLEGLASGTAIAKRWGVLPQFLPDDHPAWELESYYLALMCVNLTWMYAPEKIIFGGGVMARNFLLDKIRLHLKRLLNGYAHDVALKDMSTYIVATTLGGNAGIIGALSLSRRIHYESRR